MGTGNPYLATVVEIEEPILMKVAHSEAACAYGIAGEKHWCRLTNEGRSAQVARGPDNWAGIFTPGELGFYRDQAIDGSGYWYCYPELG